jgi:hypothetical protein
MRCLWQGLRRVHQILKTLEKELEKQGKFACLSGADRGHGGLVAKLKSCPPADVQQERVE